jgi:hypothetical protein
MEFEFGFWGGSVPRHPLFPRVAPVRARKAQGTCTALAGTFAELAEAARAGVRVRRAVFTLHRGAAPFLGRLERDELWRLFQVPALALLLDGSGRVAGYECEAQSGLHLLRPPGLDAAGMVVSVACECGRPGDRLVAASRIPPRRSERIGLPIGMRNVPA